MIDEAEIAEYYKQVEDEVNQEAQANDPVIRNVGYRYFTSKSKGIRNGKRRIRRHWKEVELIRYQTGWHQPHKVRLDCVTQELTKEQMSDDYLLWYIREHCNRNGGSQRPAGVC